MEMALMSMTGFGRARGELSSRFGVSVVIRSVNHRYLDAQIRTNLREEVPEVEAVVRSAITETLQRGRVTAQLRFEQIGSAAVDVAVNVEAVRQVADQLARLELSESVAGPVQLGDVLAVPGLVAVNSPETILDDDEKAALRSVVDEAVEALMVMRSSEGERLRRQIEAELIEIAAFADWFEPQMPAIRQRILERTRERVSDLVGSSVDVDDDRLVQEAAILADRADVAEEIVRLRAHLDAFEGRLREGGVVGRTLDFLCQEVHRELNTLGSKCRESGVAERLVDAKAAVERVREQVQNLE
jgi:uncharacterized protein (TIGR00255 family)